MIGARCHVTPPEGGRSVEFLVRDPVPLAILWNLLDRTTRIALLAINGGDSRWPNIGWEELPAPVRQAVHSFIIHRYLEPYQARSAAA